MCVYIWLLAFSIQTFTCILYFLLLASCCIFFAYFRFRPCCFYYFHFISNCLSVCGGCATIFVRAQLIPSIIIELAGPKRADTVKEFANQPSDKDDDDSDTNQQLLTKSYNDELVELKNVINDNSSTDAPSTFPAIIKQYNELTQKRGESNQDFLAREQFTASQSGTTTLFPETNRVLQIMKSLTASNSHDLEVKMVEDQTQDLPSMKELKEYLEDIDTTNKSKSAIAPMLKKDSPQSHHRPH